MPKAETVTTGGEQATDDNPEALADFHPAADDTAEGGDENNSGSPDETAAPEADTVEHDLLSEEEYAKVKDNPEALRKAYNRAFTQKMQTLSGQRKLFEALEMNPRGVIEFLAGKAGLAVVEKAKDPQAAAIKTIKDRLTGILGKEAAEEMMGVIEEITDLKVKSVREDSDRVSAQISLERAQNTIEAFKEKYTDYPKYEKAMLELGKTIRPAPGRYTDFEWMEFLYDRVKAKAARADATRETIDRIDRSARSSEPTSTGVSSRRVADHPAKPTFDQAWEAGVKGIRFDHGR